MSKKFLLSYYKTVLCKSFWTRSKNCVIENRVMENRVKRGNTVHIFLFFISFYIIIGIIFSILWIRIILHDSNSWLAGWRTRRYSMTSKLDFYSIFFDSTWNWASVLCINFHFLIRIWTFPWKNQLISYFPN